MPEPPPAPVGLVLTGGGARGAYQAGALCAIAEQAERLGVASPYPIVVGTSAGAINAAFLATHADAPLGAAGQLRAVWSDLTAGQVYRTDVFTLGQIGLRWIAELSLSGFIERRHANALLDTTPLGQLLRETLPFERIDEHLASGALRGVAVTAVDYCCGTSRTFFQGPAAPWTRFRRYGERARIGLPHVLASSAIPVLFPPVAHEGHHLGDGSVRNYTPLSPAIKLGARRLIVIGVRNPESLPATAPGGRPTIARIGGSLLDAVLLDAIDLDVERCQRISQTVGAVPAAADTPLERIELCVIRPSFDVGAIAAEEVGALPRSLRHLLGGLGSPEEAAELISYLLFEPAFTRRLIDMGYRDARAAAPQLEALWLGGAASR